MYIIYIYYKWINVRSDYQTWQLNICVNGWFSSRPCLITFWYMPQLPNINYLPYLSQRTQWFQLAFAAAEGRCATRQRCSGRHGAAQAKTFWQRGQILFNLPANMKISPTFFKIQHKMRCNQENQGSKEQKYAISRMIVGTIPKRRPRRYQYHQCRFFKSTSCHPKFCCL